MGEGKDMFDVAIVYNNRYAFGITANLEGFLLSCISEGVVCFCPTGNPAGDEAMRILNMTRLDTFYFCPACGRIPFRFAFLCG